MNQNGDRFSMVCLVFIWGRGGFGGVGMGRRLGLHTIEEMVLCCIDGAIDWVIFKMLAEDYTWPIWGLQLSA